MTTTTNSPIGALLTRLAPIEPRETRAVVAAFALFFFMWAGYFAVRPVRETVAINFIGRENVADLWLYTALFSILIIPAYGTIVARLRRGLAWSGGTAGGGNRGAGQLEERASRERSVGHDDLSAEAEVCVRRWRRACPARGRGRRSRRAAAPW